MPLDRKVRLYRRVRYRYMGGYRQRGVRGTVRVGCSSPFELGERWRAEIDEKYIF